MSAVSQINPKMSVLDYDRFHRAARDGHLDLLQEGNRKELNQQDEDGMTPAMWAAYYGHLDALRLIVGRGGDPDKCDYYGNTALHCSSGNGHTDCVSFLVNFGVNMWALDNDFHTAKDVAVLNRHDDVLRLLDQAQAKHSCVNKKLVQRLKEKSVADAEKRIKSYRKMQEKAAKKAEKEEKLLERQRKRMMSENEVNLITSRLAALRRDSRFLYASSPRFSDIVHGDHKRDHGAVSKKVHQKKKATVAFKLDHEPIVIEEDPGSCHEGSSEGGKLIPVIRRDSEVMYASKTDSDAGESQPDPSRSDDRLDNSSDDAGSDFLQTADSGIGDEIVVPDQHLSIFERPGFGTMAFRTSVVNLPSMSLRNNGSVSDSIGSASSLVRRHISWEDEEDFLREDEEAENGDGDSGDSRGTHDDDAQCDDEEEVSDDDDDEGGEPIVMFLTALGFSEYAPLFQEEKIDLEALTLLTEDDLKALGIPLGPRRKLEKALQQRMKALEDPGAVEDSRL